MKRNGLWKKITSAALISAMVMSMGGMTAFADTTPVTEVPVKKTVSTDGKTYAPDTTFEFEVEVAGGESSVEGYTVYAGLANGLKVKDSTAFKFDPTASASNIYEKSGALEINGEVFNQNTQPGIYHYKLKEKKGSYEGITYDETTVYDVYVYVEYDETLKRSKVVQVAGVTDGKDASNKDITVKTELNFTNHYGDSTNFDDVRQVTVKKVVTGNQGDRSKQFSFSVKVESGDAQATEERYLVEYPNATTGETETLTLKTGEAQSILLKDNQEIVIYGLSKSDTVTVDEADYSADGYTTSYSYADLDNYSITKVSNKQDSISGKLNKDSAVITVTNNKTANVATGVVLSFAPYILIVALAGVFAVLFLRKKREEF